MISYKIVEEFLRKDTETEDNKTLSKGLCYMETAILGGKELKEQLFPSCCAKA